MIKGKKVGALMRIFSLTQEGVANQVREVIALLHVLFTVSTNGKPLVDMAWIGIPINPNYTDNCDCGLTYEALIKALRGQPWAKRVQVFHSERDDLWGTLPNMGMFRLARAGCDWGCLVSPKAIALWNANLCENISTAVAEGASVIGLKRIGTEEFISNNLTLWNIERLQEIGGFKPLNDPLVARCVRDIEHVAYGHVGAEEAVTSILMAKKGARFAFIGDDISASYASELEQVRYERMLESKALRAHLAVRASGLDLTSLRSAQMGQFY